MSHHILQGTTEDEVLLGSPLVAIDRETLTLAGAGNRCREGQSEGGPEHDLGAEGGEPEGVEQAGWEGGRDLVDVRQQDVADGDDDQESGQGGGGAQPLR